MLGLSIVSLSVIFLLDFGTVPTVWYILFFTLLGKRLKRMTFRLYDRSRDSSVGRAEDCSGMETRHP